MKQRVRDRLCLAGARRAACILVVGLGLSFVASAAAANGWDARLHDQAWACSTLFSHYPIKILNGGDNDTAVCLGEGKKGRKPMSRSEAFDLCRDQFNATSLLINWTSKGWHCRYYGR